jgi:hypothetical protein
VWFRTLDLEQNRQNTLAIWERQISRRISVPVKGNGVWRINRVEEFVQRTRDYLRNQARKI